VDHKRAGVADIREVRTQLSTARQLHRAIALDGAGWQLAAWREPVGGRAGWLAQLSAGPGDAAYVGLRSVAVGDAGWAEAGE
jgi:hypothetical protein